MGKFQKLYKELQKTLNKLFNKRVVDSSNRKEYYFNVLTVKDRIPVDNLLRDGEFIEVTYRNKSYWAVFKCPCGCNTIISLPLQNTQNPHWNLQHSYGGKPTLNPSIWQNKGCFSHFWVINGKIEWCHNTGIEPWIAEPGLYEKPRIRRR